MDASNPNKSVSNCEINPSNIRFIATLLGIVNNPFEKRICKISSLPTNTSLPLSLYGVRVNVISISFSFWENGNPSNPKRFWIFNAVLPVDGPFINELLPGLDILTQSVLTLSQLISKLTLVPT